MKFILGVVAGMVFSAILVCAVGLLAAAKADDWWTATCCSYHLKRSGQNEHNPGIGIERSVSERWRAVGGIYNNSSGNATFYAGGVYGTYRFGDFRAGTLMVLATGYDTRPIPLIAPVLSYEGKSYGANLLFMPAAGGVFGLQLKWRW